MPRCSFVRATVVVTIITLSRPPSFSLLPRSSSRPGRAIPSRCCRPPLSSSSSAAAVGPLYYCFGHKHRSLESNDCEESRHRRIAVTVYALSYIFRVHGTHTHAAAGRRTTNRSQHPACKRSDGSTTAVQLTALRSLLVQGKYRSITTQSRSIPSLPTLSVPLSPRQSSQTLAFHLFELHLPRYLINRRACDQLLLLLLLLGRQVITD